MRPVRPLEDIARASGVAEALNIAEPHLAAMSGTPRLDAEMLMAHALGCELGDVRWLHLDSANPKEFLGLIRRRLAHEPVAYITGTRGFWTIDLQVGPGVLVPRPDSETLLDAAVAHFQGGQGPRTVLDLGTGPGTLLLAALSEWPGARGTGTDWSDQALGYARRNARLLGLEARVTWRQGFWAREVEGAFDLVLSNPPYIGTVESLPRDVAEWEPDVALFAGADGLAAYPLIVRDLPRLIAPGGMAALEIGWTQAEAVSALVRDAGLTPALRHDLGGRPRCIVVTH